MAWLNEPNFVLTIHLGGLIVYLQWPQTLNAPPKCGSEHTSAVVPNVGMSQPLKVISE